MSYASVAPGRIAGVVTVALSAEPDGCAATVTYDVTSLTAEGAAFVHELESGFDAFLAHWRESILAVL